MILAINMEMIGLSIAIFLGIILVLVIVLLVAKNYLSPSGPVKVTLNGEKEINIEDLLYQTIILDFPNKKVCDTIYLLRALPQSLFKFL